MQVPVTAKGRAPGKARKITWLAVVLVVGVAWECLAQLYFFREMLVFVMLTAILICVGLIAVLAGILLQEAAHGIKRYIRGPQPAVLVEWAMREKLGPQSME